MLTSLILAALSCQDGGFQLPPPPPVVPSPRMAQPRFSPFVLPDELRIVATEPGLRPQMQLAKETFERVLGRPVTLGEPPAKSGDITLTLGYLADGLEGEPEAYSIDVFDDHAALSANGPLGIARAIARTAQLFQFSEESDAWSLPATRIDDAPAYPWRGLMLDVARFPHSAESLREAIELAHLFSLNVVHLHLSDDQAFTFPSELLPPRTAAGEAGRDRGYTREELRELVLFAEQRGIILVPEIDMPAHSSALLRARPDLFGTTDAETGEPKATRAINMASPSARKAMKGLIDEVAGVFRTSPYFHLGGDELYAPNMLKLPEFVAHADALGIALDAGDPMNAFLNVFLTDMAAHVSSKGLKPIVWEGFRPAGEHTLPNDVMVMAWHQHSQKPEDLAKAGYPLVNCGWEPLYIVPAQGWASQPDDAYSWRPTSVRQRFGGRVADLEEDVALLGAQICFWEQRPESLVPSLLALLPELSERMWGSYGAPETHAEFAPLAQGARDRASAVLRPVTAEWQTDTGADGTLFTEKVTVRLSAALPGALRYVLSDQFGAVPTATSKEAGAEPISLEKSTVVAAALFDDAGKRIGGVTQIRFERGEPVLMAAAYRVPEGGEFTAADFADLGDGSKIGTGLLMAPTPERIDAINREQFARVVPDAHVDMRMLSWSTIGPMGAYLDPARPRVVGRHAMVCEGQVEVPEAGKWSVEMKSRGGVGRLVLGGQAAMSCGTNNQIVSRSATLVAGTYGIRIEHAMLNVHNDLQVWLVRSETGDRTPLTQHLRSVGDPVSRDELQRLDAFTE